MLFKKAFLLLSFVFSLAAQASTLPQGFVYLKEVDPSIVQELRYTGYHNFIGRPIEGYTSSTECIVTRPTAEALKAVQTGLRQKGLSLKVYDCYRPQRAVNDFIRWSQQPDQHQMKAEFYPHVNKADIFVQHYVAKRSGHSRGSTLDLTLIPFPAPPQEIYHRGQKLSACFAPYASRFHDNSLDMGTGYDCLDERAHVDYADLTPLQHYNRHFLSELMVKHGFKLYPEEWWHFTLIVEPYPDTYFDFSLSAAPRPDHHR